MKAFVVDGLLLAIMLAAGALARGDEAFLGRSQEEWKKELDSSTGQKRVYAAWATAQLAGRANAELSSLEPLLKDDDATIRYWGAMGFQLRAENADKSDVEKLATAHERLRPLLKDKSAAARIAASQALAMLGQAEQALPVLVAAMDDPQDSVRIQAVAALERLGPAARPAVDTLQKATGDSSEYVKRISERSLASLGVPSKTSSLNAKAKKGKGKAKAAP
jgi:HEAT repeat protein